MKRAAVAAYKLVVSEVEYLGSKHWIVWSYVAAVAACYFLAGVMTFYDASVFGAIKGVCAGLLLVVFMYVGAHVTIQLYSGRMPDAAWQFVVTLVVAIGFGVIGALLLSAGLEREERVSAGLRDTRYGRVPASRLTQGSAELVGLRDAHRPSNAPSRKYREFDREHVPQREDDPVEAVKGPYSSQGIFLNGFETR